MLTPARPADEGTRIDALRSLNILDTSPEADAAMYAHKQASKAPAEQSA